MRKAIPAKRRGKRRLDPKWYAQSAAAFEERQAKQRKAHARRNAPPPPSDVTIRRADGTVETKPAYTLTELRRLAPERLVIPERLRQRVLARDGHACRYCGRSEGPFEMDHVHPVSKGGATTYANLVTSCPPCNSRKGDSTDWVPAPLA